MNAESHNVESARRSVMDRCWCGGRSELPSPLGPGYRICPRCGTHFCSSREQSRSPEERNRPAHPEHAAAHEADSDGRISLWTDIIVRHAGARRGTVAEAGCAEATLLRRLRDRGWQPIGIEPDAATAAAVQERTGIEIRAGTFPATPAPACDLFVACDVFKHVGEPLAFLRAVHAALRPDGLIFLQFPTVERDVPDFGSMNEKVFDAQQHVFVYSRDALVTVLETAGFAVLENHAAWRRAHDIVVARRIERPARRLRHLANLPEMFSPAWTQFIDELNAFGAPHGLRQFTNWSKLWEYPWLWHHGLSRQNWSGRRLLDLGSEQSPFPWWLAARGAHVTLVETRADWIPQWEKIRAALDVQVDWQIVTDSRLPFPDARFDAVTSFSVIEHQPDKDVAVNEVARVLKPGGQFAISFDICEPALGMTFPEWNGRALTRDEFTRLLWQHPAFGRTDSPEWNDEDIGPFLRWHRTTAPHHNYVTAAAVLQKRPAPWWRRLFGLSA